MSQRTALVTGATGLLGRQVYQAFSSPGSKWTVKGTGNSRADGVEILKCDLSSEEEISALLSKVKPNVIVHCAAQRFPDKVDKDPEAARALNITASSTLARLAAQHDAFLIYISTDYVFPGRPGEAPYAASATPAPTNLYGQTKLDGERAVLEHKGTVVLRVPVLYGTADTPSESAVNTLLDTVWKVQTEGAPVKMDHWAIRYPTNTEDVARVCRDVADVYLSHADAASLPRILQFSSEDRMTKYEICEKFAGIMGLKLDGMEANTEGNDPNAAVQRPYDCHLDTKELKDLGINVSTMDFVDWWRREVRAFRK
ncbi:uncharacterized protein J7T54_002192 [Emericellopsis cladophorae]|uniref:RmlD-like substrate binding domain-containing protein n=1 Tax=Emericellopsis cladophorae TaxID=2686198 RepID=A0A9P9Y4S6_9HYPO|nr:uncharacterized protein J7T54_002192 [Emericellopsis cladophorae]KAI6783030.1 hypothetical protein J7T54_002192 [Emericellopsis cladophorae]